MTLLSAFGVSHPQTQGDLAIQERPAVFPSSARHRRCVTNVLFGWSGPVDGGRVKPSGRDFLCAERAGRDAFVRVRVSRVRILPSLVTKRESLPIALREVGSAGIFPLGVTMGHVLGMVAYSRLSSDPGRTVAVLSFQRVLIAPAHHTATG